jgi:hypothetical protein
VAEAQIVFRYSRIASLSASGGPVPNFAPCVDAHVHRIEIARAGGERRRAFAEEEHGPERRPHTGVAERRGEGDAVERPRAIHREVAPSQWGRGMRRVRPAASRTSSVAFSLTV